MNDLLLTELYELQIKHGDFVIGESDLQNQHLLLMFNKADLKEYPTSCVGASRFVEGHKGDALSREIDMEFSKDGMNVSQINFVENQRGKYKIEIQASYDNRTN